MSTQPMSSKEYPYLDKFLIGYWNQMASEIYGGISDAFDDFIEMEGHTSFKFLKDEIQKLIKQGKIPSIESIGSSYDDPLWSGGLILTIEDIEKSGVLSQSSA